VPGEGKLYVGAISSPSAAVGRGQAAADEGRGGGGRESWFFEPSAPPLLDIKVGTRLSQSRWKRRHLKRPTMSSRTRQAVEGRWKLFSFSSNSQQFPNVWGFCVDC
jgi:hypothetical protein